MYSACNYSLAGCCLSCVAIAGTWLVNSSLAQEVPTNGKAATAERSTDDVSTELEYPGKTLRDGILNLAKIHEATVAADPNSVTGHVGVTEAYTMYWCFGFAPRDEVLAKIKSAASKAVELDGENAGARTALGISLLSEWEWAAAEKEFETAVRLDPYRAQSQHWYALYLSAQGRHQEAIAASEKAIAADSSPGMQTGRGAILYFAREWTRMIDELGNTIKDEPQFAPAYDWLGMAFVQEKRYPESIATYERAVSLSEGLAEIVAGLGHAYGLAGEEAKARAVLAKLQRLDQRWYVPPVQIAYVHVSLGEYDEAFRMLDRAFAEHSWELVFLNEEPWFDPLHTDPRYRQLVAKLNFPK